MTQPQDWLTQPGGLADRLRNLRTAAGLSGKELAETTGWAPSKVSRLENGRQMPSADDLDTWARATGAADEAAQDLHLLLGEARTVHRDWRRRMSRGQLAVQASYNDLAANSQRIRYFEMAWMPGFLQTREYAHHAFSEMVELHGLVIDDVDAAVAARIQRQNLLYDGSKQFEFLVAEPVLGWLTCPPEVMLAQLDRLQTVMDLPNVRFGILPLRSLLSVTPQNAFQLYDDLAVVETFIGETQYGDEDAKKYGRIMDLMWEDAATGSDARRLIVTAAEELRHAT